jgi:pilus assembly protein FimV
MAFTVPMTVYGLGLGPMTVKSSLDQPFLAEIELVDVGSVSLKDIKVNVADPENFEQIGLERAAVLSLLSFKIEHNEAGKEVVKVESTERMSDPYIELVIDFAWPEGQLYKAYTILLDPPGYHLVSSTIQGSSTHYKSHGPHAIASESHHRVTASVDKTPDTYGPTVTNENVWQIAQRYKSSELILPQVVLSIVGANPDAFKDHNLNGLKTGVRLSIPASREMQMVNADLATSEVMAHDKAWNDKTPIEHVLTPPYTKGQAPAESNKHQEASSYMANTASTIQAPLPSSIPQLIPNNTTDSLPANQPSTSTVKLQSNEQDAITKAELSIAESAVESVREANALLKEQLHSLQKQNDKLQHDLDKRAKELKVLQAQIQVLMTQRKALPSQASSPEPAQSSSFWPYILLLLIAGGGAGFAYWYLRIRQDKPQGINDDATELKALNPIITTKEETPSETTPLKPDRALASEVLEVVHPVVSETLAIEHEESKNPDVPVDDKTDEPELSFEPVDVDKIESSDLDVINLDAIEPEESSIKFIPTETPEEVEIKLEAPVAPVQDAPSKEETPESAPSPDFLEFESGLHHVLASSNEEPSKAKKEAPKAPPEEALSFDFSPSKDLKKNKEDKVMILDDEISQFFGTQNLEESHVEEDALEISEESDEHPDAELQKDPLKSKKALDTLMALAKTYISMFDLDSARHALDEVIEHGTKKQKAEAKDLLESIKEK